MALVNPPAGWFYRHCRRSSLMLVTGLYMLRCPIFKWRTERERNDEEASNSRPYANCTICYTAQVRKWHEA